MSTDASDGEADEMYYPTDDEAWRMLKQVTEEMQTLYECFSSLMRQHTGRDVHEATEELNARNSWGETLNEARALIVMREAIDDTGA